MANSSVDNERPTASGWPAGGCVVAAACDVRLMSGGTIGLTGLAVDVPFPTVPLEIMRHAVGPALDAMVLGAGRLTPAQAASIGLVHEVVEPDQLLATALRRADGLCAAPPGVYAFGEAPAAQTRPRAHGRGAAIR